MVAAEHTYLPATPHLKTMQEVIVVEQIPANEVAGGAGIVYVLQNPAMPGYVKIGMTDNLDQRMQQLFNSSVPAPFICHYAARVQNPARVERALHEIFGDKRAHPRREFFEIDDPNRVAAAIKLAQIENVTPTNGGADKEDTDAVARATARAEKKGNFNFEMLNIPVGAELRFVDDDDVICTVIGRNPPTVEFNGDAQSLSSATTKAKGSRWPLRGALYWRFECETLQERRERLEAEGGS